MSWTEARTELLKSLWADGLSASKCADGIGDVTRNAVIGKVNRLGLTGRKRHCAAIAKQKRKRPVEKRERLPDGALPPVKIETPVLLSGDYLCSLFELDDHTCRWPTWAEGTPFKDQRYCGIPTANVYEGRPYCTEHSSLVYSAPQDRKGTPYWVRNGKAA